MVVCPSRNELKYCKKQADYDILIIQINAGGMDSISKDSQMLLSTFHTTTPSLRSRLSAELIEMGRNKKSAFIGLLTKIALTLELDKLDK